MRYKITAFKNVEVYGFVRDPGRNGSDTVWRDRPNPEWIRLKAGEVRDRLGMIEGVDARYAPGEPAMRVGGRPMVHLGIYEPGKVYFGLLTIDVIPVDE